MTDDFFDDDLESIETVEEVEGSPPAAEEEKKEDGNTIAPFMQTLLAAHRKKTGQANVYIGTETRTVGIEPYGLALQYLMGIDVLPMGGIIFIAGDPKTYKTSAVLEFCKMFMETKAGETNGVGVVINTEGKWSDSKARSILGDLGSQLITMKATSTEEWQTYATTMFKSARDTIDKIKASSNKKTSKFKGMEVPPLLLGLDSLIGAQTEYIKGKIEDEGHGAKTFQDRAMLNTQFLAKWSNDLVGLPVTMVITNHLKDKIDTVGFGDRKTTGGGSASDFHASLKFYVARGKRIRRVGVDGVELIWKTKFNSLGPSPKQCIIPYYEKYDEHDSQVAYYDWNEALVRLLVVLQNENSMQKDRIEQYLGKFEEYAKKGTGRVYCCEALGIDKTMAMDEKVTAQVLGAKLQERGSEIREEVKKLLRVEACVKWTPETEL